MCRRQAADRAAGQLRSVQRHQPAVPPVHCIVPIRMHLCGARPPYKPLRWRQAPSRLPVREAKRLTLTQCTATVVNIRAVQDQRQARHMSTLLCISPARGSHAHRQFLRAFSRPILSLSHVLLSAVLVSQKVVALQDAPPLETCNRKPETRGCSACSVDAACGQQQCGAPCITRTPHRCRTTMPQPGPLGQNPAWSVHGARLSDHEAFAIRSIGCRGLRCINTSQHCACVTSFFHEAAHKR